MSSIYGQNIPQICIEVLMFVMLCLCFQTTHARDDDYIARDIYSDFIGDSSNEDRYLLDLSSGQKEHIVKLHNELRNKLALGRIGRFSSASRMPALKWSNELARQAKLDARSCVFGNEECRSSDKYRNGGQNVARHGITTLFEEPPMHVATSVIMDWFLEYKDAETSNMNSNNHPQGYESNRRNTIEFAVMSNDRYTSVGCAMIRNKEDGLKYYYMVCNYGYINGNGNRKPIYEKGSSGSKCREQHPDYEGLCRTSGSYNYNSVDNNRLLTLFF